MKTRFFLSMISTMIFLNTASFAALDLRFTTAITMAPSPAIAGNSVQFNVSFITSGGAVTNLKIIGGIDGTQFFERTYASIAADKTRTDLFSWTAISGNHIAWFELDPDHTCGDSNYTNNRVEKAFTVGAGGQPNLQMYVNYYPEVFNPGNTLEFTVAVNNKGSAPSAATTMDLKVNNTVFRSFNVSALQANTGVVKTFNWIVSCPSNLEIYIDPTNTNIESKESDNSWKRRMECTYTYLWDGFDYHGERIHVPPFNNQGKPWHSEAQDGDPIIALNYAGWCLGLLANYDEGVKSHWNIYLKNNNGLNPNSALKIIFNEAKKRAKNGHYQSENSVKLYQKKLIQVIKNMGKIAERKFNPFEF